MGLFGRGKLAEISTKRSVSGLVKQPFSIRGETAANQANHLEAKARGLFALYFN
jgi:hypothetical protein